MFTSIPRFQGIIFSNIQGQAGSKVTTGECEGQLREMEIYGCKGVVFMEEAKELLHGKALAQTTAVV